MSTFLKYLMDLYKKNLKEFSLKIQKDLETAKYIKIFANNLFYIWRE